MLRLTGSKWVKRYADLSYESDQFGFFWGIGYPTNKRSDICSVGSITISCQYVISYIARVRCTDLAGLQRLWVIEDSVGRYRAGILRPPPFFLVTSALHAIKHAQLREGAGFASPCGFAAHPANMNQVSVVAREGQNGTGVQKVLTSPAACYL
jgi:hypothetical protein